MVGFGQVPLYLHKKLLVEKCPYFRARSKEYWGGQKDEPLQLNDINLEGFRVVVDWIYSETLPERLSNLDDADRLWYAVQAYKAADKLGIIDLQNKIVDNELAIMKVSNVYPHIDFLLQVWQSDLSHTPCYQLVLESCVRRMVMSPMCEIRLPEDLAVLDRCDQALIDIVLCMNRYHKKAWKIVSNEDPCKYHIHTKGDKCGTIVRAYSPSSVDDGIELSD